MFKFNNGHLVTGYIKQLLKEFNLPKFKVYTDENKKQHEAAMQYNLHCKEDEKISEEPQIFRTVTRKNDELDKQQTGTKIISNYPNNMFYVPYIKNNTIQEYINNKWEYVGDYSANDGFAHSDTKHLDSDHFHTYDENSEYLNATKNLIIKNNIYDSYTHEYLGDYLRFQRDYNNIDLMPLYNCFSNRMGENIKLELNINNNSIIFDTNDNTYKYYLIPIKLFKQYTIAIDSSLPIEMCCVIYGDYLDKRKKFESVPKQTYFRKQITKFSQPFIYDKQLILTDSLKKANCSDEETAFLAELAQNEQDLKLLLKIPYVNDSTITILEGNYLTWNNRITYSDKQKANHTVLNLEHIDNYEDQPLITNLQLLQFNIKDQIPFADRLIEYLTNNVICNQDLINDNIERAQTVMCANLKNSGIFTDAFDFPGLWDDKLKYIAYEYMQQDKYLQKGITHDLLGYIDKDIEKYYACISTNKADTIASVDIYEEENFTKRVDQYKIVGGDN